MSDDNSAGDLTHRILRDIQRELADMRDDRTVIVAILNRLDAGVTSLSTGYERCGASSTALRRHPRIRLR